MHVIQGMQDEDVPWQHATKLMERLAFDDAVLTLVRDGDHRLSRPEDIETADRRGERHDRGVRARRSILTFRILVYMH